MTVRLVGPARGSLTLDQARRALVGWCAARPALLAHAGEEARADLAWLGVDWQPTSPDETDAPLTEAIARLRDAGRLYPCFETDEELAWKARQRVARGGSPVYDRAALRMTAAQRQAAEAGGKRPAWRFLLSDGARRWRDLVLGPQTVRLPTLSDPVVLRPDGTASAGFVAAVEELTVGVDLLVRAADQRDTTAWQLDVMAALGGAPDRLAIAHLPGSPAGGPTLRRLRQDGVVAEALAPVLLGDDAAAPAPAGSLAIDWRRLTSPPDMTRLRAANRRSLAALPFASVRDRLPEGADEAFWLAVRGGIDLLGEAASWWTVVHGEIVPPVEEHQAALRAALQALPAEPWDSATWDRWRAAMPDPEAVYRVITGEDEGPALSGLLPCIGRDRTMRRLLMAVQGAADREAADIRDAGAP